MKTKKRRSSSRPGVLLLLAFAAIAVHAQTYTESILYNFPLSPAGYYPHPGSLVMDSAGNLYGTAGGGGSCNNNQSSCGTIFKVSAVGVFSTLYNFEGGLDGFGPCCLAMNGAGNLYGTAEGGGAAGWGTVFKFATKTNTFTTLHAFGKVSTDGRNPSGPLTLTADGNLYGATQEGGTSDDGILFEVTPTGAEFVYYDFGFGGPVFEGLTNVLRDPEGHLYAAVGFCCLIEVTAGVKTALATPGSDDGPYFLDGTLVRDTNGNFYGGFENGTANDGLWEVNSTTDAVTYYSSFGGYLTGPLRFSGGNLYGTVSPGGAHGEGYVYEFSPGTGVRTDSYDFGAYSADGANPFSGIVRDSAGNLYGTTDIGGTYGFGTIFKLTPN
jgi:uncharacterized repeat protein (TIGR03803 family)